MALPAIDVIDVDGPQDSTQLLLKHRLAAVAIAQPPATWALAYKNLIANFACGGPKHTNLALCHINTSLENANKDSLVAEPFQYALLWYQGSFHIGHSLCLSTAEFPTLGNYLNHPLLALGAK
jgi:hypothetical protein